MSNEERVRRIIQLQRDYHSSLRGYNAPHYRPAWLTNFTRQADGTRRDLTTLEVKLLNDIGALFHSRWKMERRLTLWRHLIATSADFHPSTVSNEEAELLILARAVGDL